MRSWPLTVLSATLITAAPSPALAGGPPVRPATSAAVSPSAEGKSPATIPVPEVARRAEEVGKLLRDFDAYLSPAPMIEAIEKQLPDNVARVKALSDDTDTQLDGSPSAVTLDGLTQQWQTTRAVLAGHVNVLGQRATEIEDALQRLGRLREEWTRARADARASRAPAQVVERIDSVLGAVAITVSHLQGQRAATLVVQDAAARELAACEVMIDRIAVFYRKSGGHLLERSAVPMWQTESLVAMLADLPDRVRAAATDGGQQLRYFMQAHQATVATLGGIVLLVSLVLYAARRRTRQWTAAGQPPPAAAAVFERPISAAFMLTIAVLGLLSLRAAPPVAVGVFQLLALMPALRLAGVLVPPRYLRALYVLGAFCVVDLLRRLASAVPAAEQLIFVLEMTAGAGVLGWALGRRRVGQAAVVARAAFVLSTVALVAAAAGYMTLGVVLGAGLVGSGYLALGCYAAVRVADGMIAVALRLPPFGALAMVRRHRALVERRLLGVLHLIAISVWALLTLRYLGLRGPAIDLARTIVNAELRRGNVTVSVGDVLVFVVTIVGTFLLSRLLRFVLEEEIYSRVASGRGIRYAVSALLHYGLVVAGFMLALATLGVDLTKITILAGALGVGIGFGLQNVVNSVVSGFILFVERQIDVGDAVQIGDVGGRVQHMGLRACTVRTWDGAEVIVPNASLVSDKVTNWTLSDRLRRIDVSVRVAYGTAPETAGELLLGVARGHKHVLLEPAPIALFRGFDESGLSFELQVWTDRFETWLMTQSELWIGVHDALRDAGIEIPLPQREVWLRSHRVPTRADERISITTGGGER